MNVKDSLLAWLMGLRSFLKDLRAVSFQARHISSFLLSEVLIRDMLKNRIAKVLFFIDTENKEN